MSDETSKVFMMPDTSGNRSIDPNLLLSQMSNGGFNGNGNWIWIIFLFFLYGWKGNGMFGNSDSSTLGSTTEREMLLQAINGNGTAIANLATSLNSDFNSVRDAVTNVQSSIQNVGNQVGLTGQQVINAINSGNANLASQLSSCCCENRLAICQQTNTLTTRIDQLANGVQTGFSQVGYATAQQTNAIQQSANANTQRIVDLLNSHWQSELQQKYADAKFELSQQQQNATLIAALKTTSTTTA